MNRQDAKGAKKCLLNRQGAKNATKYLLCLTKICERATAKFLNYVFHSNGKPETAFLGVLGALAVQKILSLAPLASWRFNHEVLKKC